MQKIIFDGEYFDAKSTLECGQVFRFTPYKEGYLLFSQDKVCYVYSKNEKSVIECESENADYFYNYFDLERDYSKIYNVAISCGIESVAKAALGGKGIRILNQNVNETVISFIISQNNHIPRIKGIISRICERLGEKREFLGETYYTFPKIETLALKDERFFAELGAGYRAKYLADTAKSLSQGVLTGAESLSESALRKLLISLHGVGPKVADCIALFAFHKTQAFPVDTWMEKVYREDFNGLLTDREKIAKYFRNLFGDAGGYIQQYLFYDKRER